MGTDAISRGTASGFQHPPSAKLRLSPFLLAIADDATGALEVGGQLAIQGIRSHVTTTGGLDLATDALVVDLETRHLAAAEAGLSVASLALVARAGGIPHLYKKTDSTLRGNIASEFQALLHAFPERLLVYVPAYPKMKRTVVGGELYVDGKPLAETATAADRLNPSSEGNVPALLAAGCSDGTSDDDLRETAAAIAEAGRPAIVAGTGGFVGHWAARLPVPRRYVAPRLRIGRCLVASGSLHPASREQIRRAAPAAIHTLYLDQQPDQETVQALAEHDWAALATPGDCPGGVSARMGALVREALAARATDCLVIFGGDTALAVLAALGVTTVESAGELLPGIPISTTTYAGRQLVFVTKAGGFGGEDTLLVIKELLEKKR
jgi:uncharacterized protein YgbK (DUF1537 family)